MAPFSAASCRSGSDKVYLNRTAQEGPFSRDQGAALFLRLAEYRCILLSRMPTPPRSSRNWIPSVSSASCIMPIEAGAPCPSSNRFTVDIETRAFFGEVNHSPIEHGPGGTNLGGRDERHGASYAVGTVRLSSTQPVEKVKYSMRLLDPRRPACASLYVLYRTSGMYVFVLNVFVRYFISSSQIPCCLRTHDLRFYGVVISALTAF